jgi:hypothetical protein
MATKVPYNGSLGINIFGASPPTGHMGLSKGLYLQANLSSGNLSLFAKNTPTISGALKAQTNWDASLISAPRLNSSIVGAISYQQNDYSSNRFDSYYNTNRGSTPVQYTIDGQWQIDSLAVEDGVMAIGTKDWTSFEKYSEDASSSSIYSTYISSVYWYPIPGPIQQTVTMYTYNVHWSTTSTCSLTANGTLTLGYTDVYGNSQQIVTAIANSVSDSIIGPITSRESTPTIISWTGSPGTWAAFGPTNCLHITDQTSASVTVTIPTNLPNGAITVGNRYFLTSDLKPLLSNLIIPDLAQIFQDPNLNWLDQNSPNFEVPDYSDIYLDIVFDSGDINSSNPNLLQPVISSGNDRKVYKFGGFFTFDEFTSTLKDPATTNSKTNIDDDAPFLWYIIVKDDGTYSCIMLSDYVTWPYSYNINFPENETNIVDSNHLIVGWKTASVKSITVSKVASFPNCGKVDLYFYKYGKIESYTTSSNIIKSTNHQLITGDCIKITECLSTSKTSLTNLNGIFYVKTIDANTFGLYTDSNLSYPLNVINTKSAGKWNAINGQTWSYNTTIFSPNGKNGYGFVPNLRTSIETTSSSSEPFDRAIDSDFYDGALLKPQADLTGQRSWNNFYPFQRFNTLASEIYGIANGNKFGASLAIKKYNGSYILMVTEPGAFESFQIADDFILNQGETLPQNKFVIPSYLPYGRIHFYQINADKSINYLTTCSTTDIPWAAYEFTNNQERVLGVNATYENATLTANLIKSYNTTSSNYWNGAKFCSWLKDYTYNSTYDIYLPDQNSAPLEFGFVDSLGKSADFEIDGTNLYCFASTNVKSADFLNNLRVKNFDVYSKTFNFNLLSPTTKTISDITVNNSTYTNNNITVQKQEIDMFGSRVLMKNGNLYVGWPTLNRDQEYIYLYNRNAASYSLGQVISSDTSRGFGEYFDVSDNLLVANKYYYTDENSIPVTNPIQFIEAYKYDINSDQYFYASKISPTIDLSNPVYANINTTQYQITTNTSYDNTNNNSATYIIDLNHKFALKNNTLVIRDWNEYAGFTFNYGTNKFDRKFHKFAPVNTNQSLIKLSKGLGVSFFDNKTEWDTGQSSQAMNIFDASVGMDGNVINYLITSDIQYLNDLPLFIKTIEGRSSGVAPLFTHGLAKYYGSGTLYVQPPMPYATGLNLIAKQVDIANTGLGLFHKSTSLSSGDLNLFLRNGIASGGLPLVFRPYQHSQWPLFIKNQPTTYFKDIYSTLYMSSDIKSTPNFSGTYNLYLKSIPSDDYAATFALLVNNNVIKTNSGITLYQNPSSGTQGKSFKSTPLYISSSGYRGSGFTDTFNLLIKCPEVAKMPLFVYNIMSTGNLPIAVSGANYKGSGITFYSSGVDYPNKNMNIVIRGDL